MDSKVLISMRELSQILAAVGISIYSSQEEHILTEVKNLSISLKIIEETQSHKLQIDSPCQYFKETKNLKTIFDGERPEIEEFSTYLSTDPSCTQAIEHLEEEDMHGLRKEGDYQHYIERWFKEVTRSQYRSFLRHLLMHKHVSWLVFHIQVITAVTFSYVNKGIFSIFLCTWLHWKNSYILE